MDTPAIKISHYKIPTKEARELREALEKRNIKVYTELWDGHKHIDLSIPMAKINIEVDGLHHLISPEQMLADLNRGYYSHENGYSTIHIPNSAIHSHLNEIADTLAEVAKTREKKIHVILH